MTKDSTAYHPLPTPVAPLRIASWNVENFNALSTELPDKLPKVVDAIVNQLHQPHIIALQEIMDDSGKKDNGVVSAEKNMAALIKAIKDAGGKEYAYIEIPPKNNKDGGKPGSNIRNGFLYRIDRVKLSDPVQPRPAESRHKPAKLSPEEMPFVRLNHFNPALIEPRSTAFEKSRKPLVCQFTDRKTGEQYFIANLHLASNGMAPALEQAARTDQRPAWKENTDRTEQRQHQARHVAAFCKKLLYRINLHRLEKTHHVVVCGDFNMASHIKIGDAPTRDQTQDPVFTTFSDAGLQNAGATLPTENFSHAGFYNGAPRLMTLDHIYVSPVLHERMRRVARPAATPEAWETRISDHTPTSISVSPVSFVAAIQQGNITPSAKSR